MFTAIQLCRRLYRQQNIKYFIIYLFLKRLLQICIILFFLNIILCTIIFIYNIKHLPVVSQEPGISQKSAAISNHTSIVNTPSQSGLFEENIKRYSQKYYQYFETNKTNYIEPVLLPSNHCDVITNKNLTNIIIFIKSTVHEFELRRSLRNTWANVQCYTRYTIRPHIYFTLGRENSSNWINATIQSKLLVEHEQYHDILQFNFIESYYNLTRKLIGSIEYYATFHCSNAKFVIFIDQDFIVNPANLAKFLLSITKTQYSKLVAGYVIKNAKPFRALNSKWFISRQIYPFDSYPDYPLGGTMIFSRPVIITMNEQLRHMRLFPFDDVLIGIILEKLKIPIIHLENILPSNSMIDIRRPFITAHFKGNSHLLINVWKSLRFDKLCLYY
ncbi:unnamed protein product [Schistosoma turkestanicum]|nr:unnamed protein product [Schistosoma turkestanicum]